MIKVSVIIPVYNVELYLRECLDSIINQTLKEIEIICIDDCSSDNSYSILEEYSKKDSRIRIFKIGVNSGQGKARNIGIINSSGMYISFIDPDDYISYDYLYNLYNTAIKDNLDIVSTFNIYDDFNGKLVKDQWNLKFNNDTENSKKYINPFNNMRIYIPCNKIYKRDFIIQNNIFFMELKGGSEDSDFNFRALICEPSLGINNTSIYYYRQRDLSSVRILGTNLDYCINTIENMRNSIDYCKSKKIEFLNYLYYKVWNPPYFAFYKCIEKNKKIYYSYLHNFANEIHLKKDNLDFFEDLDRYNDYLLIKNNDSYEKYFFEKTKIELDNLKRDVSLLKNNYLSMNDSILSNIVFNFLSIFNLHDKIIIILLGIKITIKK